MSAERPAATAPEQLAALKADLVGWVNNCCGDEVRFCDCYGCSSIREIIGRLDEIKKALRPPFVIDDDRNDPEIGRPSYV